MWPQATVVPAQTVQIGTAKRIELRVKTAKEVRRRTRIAGQVREQGREDTKIEEKELECLPLLHLMRTLKIMVLTKRMLDLR